MPVIICPHCKFKNLVRGLGVNYIGNYQCRGCAKILGIKIVEGALQEVFLAEYSSSLPDSVPKEVADDFNEAVICFNAHAYKACVTMCRRAVENLAIIRGAKGDTLYERLSDLFEKGIIDKASYSLATGIRQFGGYGAHPQRDPLRDVDRGVGDLILRISERLIKEMVTK